MEYYYGIVFVIVAIFQEQVEGFIASLTCSIVGFLGNSLTMYLVSEGYNFYYAVMLLDLGMIIIAVNILNHRVGVILFIASTISVLLNVFMGLNFTNVSSTVYDIIKPYYTIMNIIIFEILLYVCLIHSKIYPWVKNYITKLTLKHLPEKYKKFITKERKL